jgi:SecD/SecF fusion protein
MQHGGLKKLSFLSLISNRLIDFMKMAKPTAILSTVLVCASLAIIFIRGKESLGYELRGGDLIAVTGTTEAEVRNILGSDLKGKDGKAIAYNLQSVNPVGSEKPSVNIRTSFGDGDVLREALVKSNQQGIDIGDTQSVGAAVGGESLIKGLWAIGLGMLGIFIYLTLRYEIPFAVGGIVAILHDVIIAAGACALFGKEIGMILIGAFLTIAGYSINDTIVIFDRIRENLRTSTDELPVVVNKSVSETLSRTLITSGSTALAVISMLVFGGQTMADFSFAMLIGMVVGTYSTIFVASPVVVWWAKYRKLNLQKSILDAELLKATIHSGLEREAPEKNSPAPAK